MPDNPSRRHVLTALTTMGLVAAASPAPTPELVRPVRPFAPQASGSAAPVNRIYAAAKAGLERIGARVTNPELVAVADFSRPSSEPRLHLVDMKSGNTDSLRVAHGKGSDPRRTGWLSHFSNSPGSDCTSEGAYLTGPYYVGEHGRSMRVIGLDPTNSNAESRAIVIHPAWYASPQIVTADGMLGRSDGCFAVSQADAEKLLARLAPGHLLIATRLT